LETANDFTVDLAAFVLFLLEPTSALLPQPSDQDRRFPFELEEFSAAAEQGSSPDESSFLAQSTEEAKQQLLQSGRYNVIDTAGADIAAAKGQGLRNCNGCEAPIAMQLGADQALIGVVTKISMTEYVVQLQVRDAQSGEVVSKYSTGLRMGANYSWSRGVRSLMKNEMLATE
jgi:hypothetical protein